EHVEIPAGRERHAIEALDEVGENEAAERLAMEIIEHQHHRPLAEERAERDGAAFLVAQWRVERQRYAEMLVKGEIVELTHGKSRLPAGVCRARGPEQQQNGCGQALHRCGF